MNLDKLLTLDNENIEISKNALLSIFPKSLELVEHFNNYFNNVFEEFGKECDVNKHQSLISKWAKDLNASGLDILQFLRSAKLIGKAKSGDYTENAKESLLDAQTILVRVILCMRLQRDFLFGISELLKCRITPAIGYIRLQAETAGIMKVMTENNLIATDWLSSISQKDNNFYRDWHKTIKDSLKSLNLGSDYDLASSLALHSRVGGIAKGMIIGHKYKKPGEMVLNYQEIDDPKELFFWFGYYIRFHKKIVNNIKTIIPELKKDYTFDLTFNSLELHENSVWNITKKLSREIKINLKGV